MALHRGSPAESLLSTVPGGKQDPISQRGIKVIHIGFQQSAFFNRGDADDKSGTYRPTLALLSDPDDLSSGDGSTYTYTVVVD